MGSTGTGNFDNGDAADWVYDLTESGGTDVLKDAFAAIEQSEYPDAPDCCIALAAAEVVAAAKGKPAADLPESIHKWVGDHEEPAALKKLDKRAAKAAKKVQSKSGLRDQWEESDDWHNWQMAVEGLLKRLG